MTILSFSLSCAKKKKADLKDVLQNFVDGTKNAGAA